MRQFWRSAICAAALWPLASVQAGGPSGCSDLSLVPMTFAILYYDDIQPLFSDNDRCTGCHGGLANLFLEPDFSYGNLVGINSSQQAGLLRVTPGDPLNSLLFQKLACDNPEVGARMPLDGSPIPIEEQALVMDWILLGAGFDTDPLFRDQFEAP